MLSRLVLDITCVSRRTRRPAIFDLLFSFHTYASVVPTILAMSLVEYLPSESSLNIIFFLLVESSGNAMVSLILGKYNKVKEGY